MNYLGSLYLSRHEDEMRMLGCMIGEIIRTSNEENYTPEILEGIELRKKIENYMKEHPAYLKSRERLPAKYNKSAHRLLCIFYDHFLAAQWKNYSDVPYDEFVKNSYALIKKYQGTLPYKHKKMVGVMQKEKTFENFPTLFGMHQFMTTLTKRDTLQDNFMHAMEQLMNNYDGFRSDFTMLMDDLIKFVEVEREQKMLLLQV